VTRLRHILLAIAALALVGALAPPAFASYQDVIRECYDRGELPPGKYSRHELLQARRHLRSDIREYSDCEDLINAALAYRKPGGGAPGGGAGPGAGGGYNPTPDPQLTTPSGAIARSKQDYDALAQATDPRKRRDAPPRVSVAGRDLSPSTSGVIAAADRSDSNAVPLPLLLALAALAGLTALAIFSLLRRHWPVTRRAALRLLRR
jgi:hypothetical protein